MVPKPLDQLQWGELWYEFEFLDVIRHSYKWQIYFGPFNWVWLGMPGQAHNAVTLWVSSISRMSWVINCFFVCGWHSNKLHIYLIILSGCSKTFPNSFKTTSQPWLWNELWYELDLLNVDSNRKTSLFHLVCSRGFGQVHLDMSIAIPNIESGVCLRLDWAMMLISAYL